MTGIEIQPALAGYHLIVPILLFAILYVLVTR
jgi:hypothetical protein